MVDPMTSIGVDLAWGDKGTTGLCAVVGDRVMASTALRTDAEICDWLRPWLSPATIVAVDAPLVVPNASGQRPAERLVAVLFGAAGGSAHSANRSRPSFADGGRGARIAAALGLSVDPAASLPTMIEVYPHPALIALFGLPRVLAYKAKPSRSVAGRQNAFRDLLAHLESLVTADPGLDMTSSPRWATIHADLEAALTQGALDRLEDEIDAYACAYVGLYRLRWGDERSAVLGSLTDGYIVTPLDDERLIRYRGNRDAGGFGVGSRPSDRAVITRD